MVDVLSKDVGDSSNIKAYGTSKPIKENLLVSEGEFGLELPFPVGECQGEWSRQDIHCKKGWRQGWQGQGHSQ
eukprot:6846723-Ditylum_brightwellii.AAC.1